MKFSLSFGLFYLLFCFSKADYPLIEMVTMCVKSGEIDEFLRLDDATFGQFTRQSGIFQRREIWIDLDDSTTIHVVNRLKSYDQWKKISKEEMEKVQRQFDEAVAEAKIKYEFIDSSAFRILPEYDLATNSAAKNEFLITNFISLFCLMMKQLI